MGGSRDWNGNRLLPICCYEWKPFFTDGDGDRTGSCDEEKHFILFQLKLSRQSKMSSEVKKLPCSLLFYGTEMIFQVIRFPFPYHIVQLSWTILGSVCGWDGMTPAQLQSFWNPIPERIFILLFLLWWLTFVKNRLHSYTITSSSNTIFILCYFPSVCFAIFIIITRRVVSLSSLHPIIPS